MDHMDNRRMGSEGSSVVLADWIGERPMEIARTINHAVIATEWVARVILFLAALLVIYYAADREPPFALLSVEHAEAKAGDYVTIHAAVRRDTSRGCNSSFSRYLFDSSGARYDLGTSAMSADAIAQMDRKMPGKLVISFHVPQSAHSGQASLQTVIHHHCNRVHSLGWPIETTIEMPFLVLP
jgi:hypothetical protein